MKATIGKYYLVYNSKNELVIDLGKSETSMDIGTPHTIKESAKESEHLLFKKTLIIKEEVEDIYV